MEDFDFCAFMEQYALTLDLAAMVFGTSRRTVTRWRTNGQIPHVAAQLARSILLSSPPWTNGFRRGFYVGARQLPLAFRQQYFGEKWVANTLKLDEPRFLAVRKRSSDAQEAMAAAYKLKLLHASRKAQRTRAARMAAELAGR